MPSKSHSSKTHPPQERERSAARWIIASIVAGLAAIYVGWFLSYPVLPGMLGADGEPMTRLLFMSRVMLPEMWWNEMAGDGRLPLGFWERWPLMIWIVAWLGAAYVAGRPVVQRAFQTTEKETETCTLTWAEYVSLAILAGLAVFSTATLVVGLAGWSAGRGGIILAVAVILSAAWIFTLRKRSLPFATVRWLPVDVTPMSPFGQLAGRLVVVLTIVLIVIYSLGAMMPPFEFDVVEYHLQSAKEFYQVGYIGFNDHNIYINMPLGLEMHSLAAMSILGGANVQDPDGWWFGGLAGKAVIGIHSILGSLLIGGFVARRADSRWIGWCAAGLWLSVPGNAYVATAGLIDAALSTYILASLVAVTELWQRLFERNDESVMRESKWIVLVIFLYSGAAAAAKYPGLIYAVVPCFLAVVVALFIVPEAIRISLATKWLLPIACGLSLTCVPWYVKNAVLTGNPVYPLAYSVFGGKGLDSERAKQWSTAHRVPEYSLNALINSAKQIVVASDETQPVLILLVICGLVGPLTMRRVEREQAVGRQVGLKRWLMCWSTSWVAASVWILVVWWVATHRIDRFWLPVVSIWAVLAGSGLAWLATRVSHGLATALVLFALSYGIVVNASPAIGDNRFFVSLQGLRTDGGDDENVGRLSRPIAWCNDHLTQSQTKLLLVGEARGFDFRMPILCSTCFDRSPAEMLLRGKTGEQQRANLRAVGATHLMVNWSEIGRYRTAGNYGFSDWPSHADIGELLESGVIRRVEWPIAGEAAELFQVITE